MRKIRLVFSVVILALCCAASIPAAYGTEAIVESLGCVRQGGAELTATIREVGASEEGSLREQALEATITATDGSFSQTFPYDASVSLTVDSAAGFAMLDDLNFDGYQDLCLLTAAGARNVFQVFALWNAETGCFDPIMQGCPWIPEENRFAQESSPLELCCYQLLPETRQIVSEVADGYRYRSIVVYEWEGSRSLVEKSVATIFDAGDGLIGERLEMFGTQIRFCWLESYPESWYYEQEGVFEERLGSLKALMLGNALSHPVFLRVCAGTWVN
ncbi:MAG: hypothetical protein PHI98_15740, partial [Eubacteriales bacterium]|nr:hypothetical protein [Eubacteriales bacterium]